MVLNHTMLHWLHVAVRTCSLWERKYLRHGQIYSKVPNWKHNL